MGRSTVFETVDLITIGTGCSDISRVTKARLTVALEMLMALIFKEMIYACIGSGELLTTMVM